MMKAKSSLLSLFILCLGLTLPLEAQQNTASPSSSPPQQSISSAGSDTMNNALDQMGVKKYQLGTGDVLYLRVYGEPQFDGPIVVDDMGNIELPFIEEPILARCRTDREIKEDVVAALKKFIKKPQVAFRLAEAKSRPPAVVFGAVRQATRVQMNRKARLLELLSQTGGVTEQAGGDIQIFHTEPVMCPEPGEEVIAQAEQTSPNDPLQVPFNVYKITDLKLGKQEANPIIRPGDIIIVQEATPIYVTGAVLSPSNLYLRENMSLTRAIAQVGGIRKGAKPSEVRIYRQKLGALRPEIIKADYDAIKKQKKEDIALMPYDIIEVPEGSAFSPKNLPQTLLNFAMGGANNVVQNSTVRILY